mmetsp:Transcript_5144/g.16505  ORF Transcript_5144/g.16505 Transcript_5144/m.16505 type:complete len:443 (-) Transcript_5144:502-1830(-)
MIALAHDEVTGLEMQLCEKVHQPRDLIVLEALKRLNLAEHLDQPVRRVAHEHRVKGFALKCPECAFGLRTNRGGTRLVVHERQLTKAGVQAIVVCVVLHDLARLLVLAMHGDLLASWVVGHLVHGHLDRKATRGSHVEAIALVELLDHNLARFHFNLLHRHDGFLELVLAEVRKHVVVLQRQLNCIQLGRLLLKAWQDVAFQLRRIERHHSNVVGHLATNGPKLLGQELALVERRVQLEARHLVKLEGLFALGHGHRGHIRLFVKDLRIFGCLALLQTSAEGLLVELLANLLCQVVDRKGSAALAGETLGENLRPDLAHVNDDDGDVIGAGLKLKPLPVRFCNDRAGGVEKVALEARKNVDDSLRSNELEDAVGGQQQVTIGRRDFALEDLWDCENADFFGDPVANRARERGSWVVTHPGPEARRIAVVVVLVAIVVNIGVL